MRTLLPISFLVALLVSSTAFAQDADTLHVNGKTFRLDGIDAPEIDQNCLDEKGALYACGRQAAQALENFVAGRAIRCDDLHADPAYPQRRIGQCYVAGTYLNQWLVQQGWAINFEPYAHGRFEKSEQEAREAKRGIWRGCFIPPRDFRRWNKRSTQPKGAHCVADKRIVRDLLLPDDPAMPPGCEIKGKVSRRDGETRRIYHVPGCRQYGKTNPNRWFCSDDEAQAAGFRKARTCPAG